MVWLDDILVHAPTIPELIEKLNALFDYCASYNLKLHPLKCILFATVVRWCGRLISAEGVRFDPRRLDGIQKMQPPTLGSHLQQFVCAMQWMRSGIPDFSNIVRPLMEFLERVYTRAGKRTRTAAARIQLSDLGWSQTELEAFNNCKNAVAHQVTLSHPDPKKRLCVYTDASDYVWSGIVTQTPREDIHLDHVDQRHQPLSFLSGHFTGSELGWSILEKEAYAIMATVERMHWLLATPSGFDLFTDHHNLIFIFDPVAVMPDLSQSSVRKVLRGAVKLSAYNYMCIHIRGIDNVWADLLGRWSAPPSRTIRRLVHIPELPSSSSDNFDWPNAEEVLKAQQKFLEKRPSGLTKRNNLWVNENVSIWIPDESDELQLRLCIIAHTGPSGHRGCSSTLSTLSSAYHWSTIKADVKTFVQACIHCLSTVGGEKIPRPYGPAVHGTSPNDLLQFDYIEIAPGEEGDKYILMLRDDHSDYKWFFAFGDTSAENASRAIIDCCAAFGVPKGLMSDGPTHFKNETVHKVSKGLKVPHHFTLPYTPWSKWDIFRVAKRAYMLRLRYAPSSKMLHFHDI